VKKNQLRVLLALSLLLLVGAFFVFDLGRFLSLEVLKNQHEQFLLFYEENTLLTAAIYFVIYIVVTALSLPGAAIMTLAGGAIFGFWSGLVLVSFASSIGATLAFLVSRFLFKDWVEQKFQKTFKKVNHGIQKEGAFYLFTLRLVPLFPFFLINLVVGLTKMKTRTFFLVSQVGMLPGTAAYVNAGTQLASIDSLGGILSLPVILSFAVLGILPLVLKKGVDFLRAKKGNKPIDQTG